MSAPNYFRIDEGSVLPDLSNRAPFLAVIIIEGEHSPAWQERISDWLVADGCRYALTWGKDCAIWHDAIDWAELKAFDFREVPDDRLVMTTWHDDEPLEEVFWFAGNCAHHPEVELRSSVIVDIGPADRQQEMLTRWQAAQEAELN